MICASDTVRLTLSVQILVPKTLCSDNTKSGSLRHENTDSALFLSLCNVRISVFAHSSPDFLRKSATQIQAELMA